MRVFEWEASVVLALLTRLTRLLTGCSGWFKHGAFTSLFVSAGAAESMTDSKGDQKRWTTFTKDIENIMKMVWFVVSPTIDRFEYAQVLNQLVKTKQNLMSVPLDEGD